MPHPGGKLCGRCLHKFHRETIINDGETNCPDCTRDIRREQLELGFGMETK